MATQQDLINALNQLNSTLNQQQSSRQQAGNQASSDPFGALLRLEVLKRAMNALTGAIQRFIPLQEKLISSNKTLQTATDLSFKQLQTLDGGLAIASENIARLIDSGLDPNNTALLNLAGRTVALGQDIGGLIKANENLLGNGIVSQKNMTTLNKSILDTSIQQGISIDRLVDSIDSLTQNLDFAVLGEQSFIAATGIVQEAAKILPKATLGNVEALVGKVFDPNNFEKLAAMGLQDISTGRVDPSIALRKLIEQGQRFADITQGQGLEVARSIYSVYGQDFVQLLESLANAEKLSPQERLFREQKDAFDKSITSLKEKLSGPLNMIAMTSLNSISKLVEMISQSAIVTEFIPKIADFITDNSKVITSALAGVVAGIGSLAAITSIGFLTTILSLGPLGIIGALLATLVGTTVGMNLYNSELLNSISKDTKRSADADQERLKQEQLSKIRSKGMDTRFNEFARRFMQENIGNLSLINSSSNSENREILEELRKMNRGVGRGNSLQEQSLVRQALAGRGGNG